MLVMVKLLAGHTYYAGDVLFSQPLWYDWVHTTSNYDLIDSAGLYYAHDWLYNQQLHLGRLLTWNPYNFCGHPIFADGKSAFLYPPKFLAHRLLPATYAHDLLLWVHLTGMGIFFHRWLRALGLSTMAARLGGSAWMLAGFVQTWLQSEYTVTFGCWLPLILERQLAGLGGPHLRRGPCFQAALLLGLLGYCGHVQFLAHSYLFCGLWGLYLVLRQPSLCRVAAYLAMTLSPPLLAAPQLLPLLELVARSERLPVPFSHQQSCFRYLMASLPVTLVCPNFFGSLPEGIALRHISQRGTWVQLESCGYLSLVGLCLLFLSRRSSHYAHWRFLTGVTLALAILPATPLYAVVVTLIPPLQKTIATRWLFHLTFLACCHIAYGAAALESLDAQVWRRARRVSAALLGLWASGWLATAWLQAYRPWGKLAAWLLDHGQVRYPFPETFANPKSHLQAVTLGLQQLYHPLNLSMLTPGVALLALIFLLGKPNANTLKPITWLLCLDLLLFSWRFNSTSPRATFFERPSALGYLQEHRDGRRVLSLGTLRPNTGVPFGILDVGGQDSVYPGSVNRLLCGLETGNPDSHVFADMTFPLTNWQSPVLPWLGVGWLLAYPQQKLPDTFEAVHQQSNGITLYRWPGAPPVAYRISTAAPSLGSRQDLSEALQKTGHFRVGTDEGKVSEFRTRLSAVQVIDQRPGAWSIYGQGPGWLVVSETFDPGWSARLDGTPVALQLAQGAFMAVALPAGAHRLELDYQPPRLRLGLGLAGLTFSFLLLGFRPWARNSKVA